MTENEVVKENYGLAVDVANRYFYPSNSYSLEDLIQCALMGIAKAHRRYEPDHKPRKTKFSTFATVCARNEILKFLKTVKREPYPFKQESTCRHEELWELLPSNLSNRERTVTELKIEGHSNYEIAEITGISRQSLPLIINSAYNKIGKSLNE